ncbi:AzlC family ABC transporter permease [Limisalsivibrio acetivorans]|uniref:AzlC family ABC transporter permease n=1 Tax=Limisalsivibrio acetivorans TaxID=1304888 RepID=UPI0003B61FB5|nr:AzlC family ABC transporter permease [Limisalsivibrio acetivorans]
MNDKPILTGVRSAFPIAAGYFPIAVSFGLTAVSAGLEPWLAVLMSLIVFAGASQFVAANLFAVGIGGWEIVLTTFVLNFRHFLMSSSLSRRLSKDITRPRSAVAAFGITDETFAMASMRKEKVLPEGFLYGLNFTAYAAWCSGTVAGVLAGSLLADSVKSALTFGLYALFIGLLVPEMKRTRPAVTAGVSAMAVNGGMEIIGVTFLSAGWKIMIATVAGAMLAAFIHREEEDEA